MRYRSPVLALPISEKEIKKGGVTVFRIKIAGVIVEIDNRFDCVKTQCKAYTIECGTPEMSVSATDEDIRAYRAATPFFIGMSDGEIESRVIYQKICEQMPAHGAYLFHSVPYTMQKKNALKILVVTNIKRYRQ